MAHRLSKIFFPKQYSTPDYRGFSVQEKRFWYFFVLFFKTALRDGHNVSPFQNFVGPLSNPENFRAPSRDLKKFRGSLPNHAGCEIDLSRNNAITFIQFPFLRSEKCPKNPSRFPLKGPLKLHTNHKLIHHRVCK